MQSLARDVMTRIRVFPDFPRAGVKFCDLAPVFADPVLLRHIATAMADAYAGDFSHILAVEARGFLLGSVISQATGRPLLLARKAGRLPGPVHTVHYDLEYGSAALELQKGAVAAGDRVLVVDDVVATGGTLAAAGRLVAQAGADLAGYAVVLRISVFDTTEALVGSKVFEIAESGAAGRPEG